MKATLDHNVIIDLAIQAPRVARIRDAIEAGACQPSVTEIGASEMRKRGVKPDRFDLFEELLAEAGLSSARRLSPMMRFDVTFWDHCLWTDDAMEAEAAQIDQILFGDSKHIAQPAEIDDSPESAAWLNRLCDVQTMWCHIKSDSDVFVTSDGNFFKATKLPRLLQLGARKIHPPEQHDA